MKFLVVYDYETEEDGELIIIEIEDIVEAETQDDVPEPFHHWIKSITPISYNMNKEIKREIRLCLLQMFSCHNDMTDYLDGIIFSLLYSNLITHSTYHRFSELFFKYRYSQKMISFRGIK